MQPELWGTVGRERVRGLAKGGAVVGRPDKGGWVFTTMSKEVGSPRK